jgi:regulator of sirC expression with transglutaminase-like and TPR domain
MTEAVVADRELQALVSLLESEGYQSVALLTEQIRSFPKSRLVRLARLARDYPTALSRIELVLTEIEAPLIEAELRRWRHSGQDIESGMDLIARVRYPLLPEGELRRSLDRLSDEIERRLPTADTAKRLRALVYCVHQVLGFKGSNDDYYSPDNSYLTRVIERRTGIPLSLSVLYSLLGRRLSLDIGVIGLPGHVIASMPGMASPIYFDPFHEGKPLGLPEITQLVTAAGYVFHPEQLRRASPIQIMQRTLANLESAYDKREDGGRATLIQQFRLTL